MEQLNLWGSGFEIESTPSKIKKVKEKVSKPKSGKVMTEKNLKVKNYITRR